jgi:hypothetical protein
MSIELKVMYDMGGNNKLIKLNLSIEIHFIF